MNNNCIYLPLDIDNMPDITSETNIDMSKLDFPCEKDKQQNAAFIFIRNLNINANFIFDNCSFEEKSRFLMIYMSKYNLDVTIPILSETWLNIIANGYIDIPERSILTNEEIKVFIEENKDFIFEIRRLTISIPLCTIGFYGDKLSKDKSTKEDLNEFDITGYEFNKSKSINTSAFVTLFDYDVFIIIQQSITDINPQWYVEYFQKENNKFFGSFISKFPYIDLLNMFNVNNESVRSSFIELLNQELDNQIQESTNSESSDTQE